MRTDFIEEFVALADELNFTRAAERANVTQPALSKHIASMERELGVRLFERDKRSVALTEAGEALLDDAREAAVCFELMRRAARRYRPAEKGSLSVGYLRGVAEAAIPGVHRAFEGRCPETDVSYEPYSYNRLVEALEQGKADVAIGVSPTWRSGVFDEGIFSKADLFADCLCAVTNEGHPLSKHPQKSVCAEELANETILSFPSTETYSDRSSLVEYFRSHGVEVTFLDRFDSAERLPLQIVTEDCVAFLPSHLKPFLDEWPSGGSFTFTPLSDYGRLLAIQMYWRREDPLARAFAQVFLDLFEPPETLVAELGFG